ncbi:MAG: hypothetical protein R3F59_30600 [Myxococcota bacterium]
MADPDDEPTSPGQRRQSPLQQGDAGLRGVGARGPSLGGPPMGLTDEIAEDYDTDLEPPEPDPPSEADPGRSSRVLKFARRLMDRRELAEDTKELLHAVLNTSDKAKTEAVRLMAREFRSYLKELKLKEDLIKLATSHSLEISISLKPLTGDKGGSDSEGG